MPEVLDDPQRGDKVVLLDGSSTKPNQVVLVKPDGGGVVLLSKTATGYAATEVSLADYKSLYTKYLPAVKSDSVWVSRTNNNDVVKVVSKFTVPPSATVNETSYVVYFYTDSHEAGVLHLENFKGLFTPQNGDDS